MSPFTSALLPPDFDQFDLEGLDFFHPPSDVLAPHPDLFESELDSSLAACGASELQLFTVDSNIDPYFWRSDTPTCGPPSTLTASSESAYDSLSSYSESFYNYPPHSPTNYSFLEMDFQRIRVDAVPDYAAVNPSQTNNTSVLATTVDPTSFGTLPPTPPHSPPVPSVKSFDRSSFSDYGPPTRLGSSASPDYFGQLSYTADTLTRSTVSPSRVSTQLPLAQSIPLVRPSSDDGSKGGDPRKKYKCNVCPRGSFPLFFVYCGPCLILYPLAFARAYNLKTHMATHDPNRLKPHVCPHHSCGRSFSRKHDLGRHLVSIHRDDSVTSSHHSASPKKPIGVERGPRGWCDSCGKSWVGRDRDCTCK